MRNLASVALVIVALIASAAPARADVPCAPAADEPSPYAPAPPPGDSPCARARPPCTHSGCSAIHVHINMVAPRFASDDDLHEFLWRTNDAYRSALTLRRFGTALWIIGGASTILLGSIAGAQSMECANDGFYDGSTCDVSPALYVGVAAGAIALAVGVTLAITGHHRVKKIRERFHVGIAPLPGGGTAALSMRF